MKYCYTNNQNLFRNNVSNSSSPLQSQCIWLQLGTFEMLWLTDKKTDNPFSAKAICLKWKILPKMNKYWKTAKKFIYWINWLIFYGCNSFYKEKREEWNSAFSILLHLECEIFCMCESAEHFLTHEFLYAWRHIWAGWKHFVIWQVEIRKICREISDYMAVDSLYWMWNSLGWLVSISESVL